MNIRVLYTLFSALVILLGSYAVIRYAQGYRFSSNRVVQGTGLLFVNSTPEGAEVFVNGKLITTTDDKIHLEPGQYDVEIRLDGYTPWRKTVTVEQELVTQTDAQLFKRVPSLSSLTFAGVKNILPSPDGEKLLFYTASASAQTKNGLYILELTNSLLTSQKEPRQIAEETAGFDLENATYVWSPDNSQVLVSTNGRDILLNISSKNTLSSLPDVGLRKKQILSEWESELYLREREFLSKFPSEVIHIATTSARNVYISPDKKRVMYLATASANLPENISPTITTTHAQPEERSLEPGTIYVYDREIDKNFKIAYSDPRATSSSKIALANDLHSTDAKKLETSPLDFQNLSASTSAQTATNFAQYYSSLYSTGLQWFPDSKHLLYADEERVYLLEYDNTNKTTVYEGRFDSSFIYPWPDGSKILILTTFSSSSSLNLYAIELK